MRKPKKAPTKQPFQKPKPLTLPKHLQDYLSRLQMKAEIITEYNGKEKFVISGFNYIKIFKTSEHLLYDCKCLFAKFFYEYMLARQDISISNIDKINWFVMEHNIELDNELTQDALVKNWYRFRKREKRQKALLDTAKAA